MSASGTLVWHVKKEDFVNDGVELRGPTVVVSGFEWKIGRDFVRDDWLESVPLWITCLPVSTTDGTLWSCEAYGSVVLLGVNANHHVQKTVISPLYIGCNLKFQWSDGNLTHLNCCHLIPLTTDTNIHSFDWKHLFPDGTYRFEVNIKTTRHQLLPNPADAACLEIEGKKLYVSKTFLSLYSPYFGVLFFSSFKEQCAQVIPLRDVNFYDFLEFLAHLYPQFDVDYELVPNVLTLADMYGCDSVINSCQDVLLATEIFEESDLVLADKFDLAELRKRAVAQISLKKLMAYARKIVNDPKSLQTRLMITERIDEELSR
uniref:BTB domain-containing protein n=1 Tax=Steinernema glaseri TaxID=37863 RepID=A0A1I7YD83_9BILA